jgi:hypothetical protein
MLRGGAVVFIHKGTCGYCGYKAVPRDDAGFSAVRYSYCGGGVFQDRLFQVVHADGVDGKIKGYREKQSSADADVHCQREDIRIVIYAGEYHIYDTCDKKGSLTQGTQEGERQWSA